MTRTRLSVVAALLALGCGSTAGDGSGAAAPSLEAFDALGAELAVAVQSYGADAAAVATGAQCDAVHAGYHAHLAEAARRMGEQSAWMDEHMEGWGCGAESADLSCAHAAMEAELGRHHGVACASGDLATDRDEARHHVEVMAALVEHQRRRTEEAQAGTGMGMHHHEETTFACVHHDDGSFTFDGEPWAPGCEPGTPIP
jgi:hypothetical protein